MPKVLTYIEYAMFVVSVISLFFILFLVGDTDILSEPPTWVRTVLTVLACFSAAISAGIHWVGLPMKTTAKANKKKSVTSPEPSEKS